MIDPDTLADLDYTRPDAPGIAGLPAGPGFRTADLAQRVSVLMRRLSADPTMPPAERLLIAIYGRPSRRFVVANADRLWTMLNSPETLAAVRQRRARGTARRPGRNSPARPVARDRRTVADLSTTIGSWSIKAAEGIEIGHIAGLGDHDDEWD